jgi:hypothetical protein
MTVARAADAGFLSRRSQAVATGPVVSCEGCCVPLVAGLAGGPASSPRRPVNDGEPQARHIGAGRPSSSLGNGEAFPIDVERAVTGGLSFSW